MRNRTCSQLRSHCQKYILKICKKYNFKLKNRICKIKNSKYLSSINDQNSGNKLQNITEEEENFLIKLKYYELSTKPFKILKNSRGITPCRHQILNLREANKLFKITKIKIIAVDNKNNTKFDNFFKQNFSTATEIDKLQIEEKNKNLDINLNKKPIENLAMNTKTNTTGVSLQRPVLLSQNSELLEFSNIPKRTNNITLALMYQLAQFQNLMYYNCLSANLNFNLGILSNK